MNLWRRYPGRLAHLEDGRMYPVTEAGVRVGTDFRTVCGRTLRLFWDDRPWSSDIVPLDLTFDDGPRWWCLRCRWWALVAAGVLSWRQPFRSFADAIERGEIVRLGRR